MVKTYNNMHTTINKEYLYFTSMKKESKIGSMDLSIKILLREETQ